MTFKSTAAAIASLILLLAPGAINAQTGSDPAEINPADYDISNEDIAKAEALLASNPKDLKFPNPRKGARWYPEASLGLFMHWGIHSMLGAQPSWTMIQNYIWNGGYHSREEYYGQAKKFNPEGYNPDRYLEAVKEAGFGYAVLTTRHHDGYALWPSKYGIGTKQYMGGRDLVGEYVSACRRCGLKVGLYYSPRDWHYPGAFGPEWFDEATRNTSGQSVDPQENHRNYVKFLAYVMTQLEELLTRYGRIDVLWLDGMGWDGIKDLSNKQIYSWIRSLQPDIVINDRWSNIVDPDNPDGTSIRYGDFTTPFECLRPTYTPSEWWEHCDIWTSGGGGWGYDRRGKFRPLSWFFGELAASRSLGGNFLPNVGPDPDGNMHPNFYKEIDSVKEWMSYGKESLIGAGPTPGVRFSNVPLTTRGKKIWYAHILKDSKGEVSVKTEKAPKSLTLMRTGEAIPYLFRNGFISFKLNSSQRTYADDVVKIEL